MEASVGLATGLMISTAMSVMLAWRFCSGIWVSGISDRSVVSVADGDRKSPANKIMKTPEYL